MNHPVPIMKKLEKLLLLLFSSVCIACQSDQAERILAQIISVLPDEAPAVGEVLAANADTGTIDPPAGYPLCVRESEGDQILLRSSYTVCYDAANRIPRWVEWILTAEHTMGSQPRLNNFLPDEEVAEPRAELADYKGSGYDRGHMCPAGDNKWGYQPMRESFLLTNVCPQDQNLNSGDWNELESQCREWAKQYGSLYIACGPILRKAKGRTIGRNRVRVPEAFFKVVLCPGATPKALGFIYENQPCNRPLSAYVVTVDEVERQTGLDFFPFLEKAVEAQVEATARLEDW